MASASYKRTAHRWRLLLLMLFAVFCAFGSFWLVQVMQGEDNTPGAGAGNEPDYIIDNFSWVRMGGGAPEFESAGDEPRAPARSSGGKPAPAGKPASSMADMDDDIPF